MTMNDGGDLTLPLRIDTSQVESDLRAVSTELQRLERQAQRVFNQNPLVGKGRGSLYSPAQSVEDVRANVKGLSASQMQAFDPRLAQALRDLDQYNAAITRTARAGRGVLPPTERQLAQQRLAGVERQNRPTQVELTQGSIDKFGRTLFRQVGPNLAGMAASRGGIGGAGSLMRMFMGAAESDPYLFAALLGTGLVGGGALLANQNQVSFQRTAASLASATVGGPLLGDQRLRMGLHVAALSPGFSVSPDTVYGMAQTLGQAGVGRGSLTNDLKNAIMLAGPNQLPYGDVAQLTAALGTGGQMGPGAINQTYQDLQNVAHDSGVSIQQLVASMKALSTTAVGSARDVGGLAAVQALIGTSSGINAGQLLAPTLGATGGQALQTAALLGLSPQQLLAAQSGKGGTALLFDRMSALVRRVGRGPAGTDVAEQLLTSTGLINPQAISSPQQFAALIHQMQTGTPQQAAQAAQKLYTQSASQRVSQEQSYQKTAQVMQDLTTASERASYGLQYLATSLLNRPGTPGRSSITPYRPGAIQATGPMPGDTTFTLPGTAGVHLSGQMIPNGTGYYNPLPSKLLPQYIAGAQQLARLTGVSQVQALQIMLAQGSRESAFNPNAPGGGIAQFTPATAAAYGLKNPYDSAQSIQAQARYDADLYRKAGGNWQEALAMYNGGPHPDKQAQAYGKSVYDASQLIVVNVTVTDKTAGGVNAAVDHQRKVAGHVTHGPPALPHRRG